jgi:hypothetical protein
MGLPIPPNLLGLTGPAGTPVPLGAPNGPGANLSGAAPGPGGLGASLLGGITPGGPMMTGGPPPVDPNAAAGDPVLGNMLATLPELPPFDPWAGVPDTQKPGYMPKFDAGVWQELANLDQEQYKDLLKRFSRDLALYRKRISAKPPGFDKQKEIAFKSATIANIVNKLTNMAAPLDARFEVPFKDETSKEHSQIMENWYGYLRKCEEIEYAVSGGASSLQWDEFFYLFLYGRLCCRILPNLSRPEHPFDVELVDPATVFPVWGGATEGLVRLTHRRSMSAIDVISTYMPVSENLYERMQDSLMKQFDFAPGEVSRSFYIERELIEGWDTWNQWVSWGDVEILNEPHKLGYVPWVYVMAKGEPRGMTTPEGKYWVSDWEDPDDPETWVAVSDTVDLAEKGVSVFHHIINSDRMSEVVYTLLVTEVIKASNPATITYSASQMAGVAPPPLNFKPGGNNQRTLNAQRVEIAPTSPRPTDTSPVMGKLSSDITEGSVNPAMYGAVEGSNIAGFAIESMIAAAKDTVLPYLHGWEIYQQSKATIYAKQYRDKILPIGSMSIPMEGKYGSSPAIDVTADVIQSAGTKVTVDLIGVSDQQLPMLVNAAGAAVERGFWSRRKAMEKLGEKDPSKMIQDIIIERALEHPEMMENFLIPINFIRAGQKDLADLWVLMIVMPKVQQLMAQMLPQGMGAMGGVQASGAAIPGGPPGAPPGMPSGGGTPPGPAMLGAGAPEPNGQSNPMAGRARGAPTGPQPGQGRGPAPAPLGA